MEMATMRCMCCGLVGLEPATTRVEHGLNDVKVAIEGVPAMRCKACGAISTDGKIAIPIEDAIEQILIAAGAMPPPDPKEEAALQAENRALARSLVDGDAIVDAPDEVASGASASEPSGAGSPAR